MQSKSSFLPTDATIFERSINWANLLSRTLKDDKDRGETYFYYHELPSCVEDDDESETEDTGQKVVNNAGAIVKANNFEGSTSSDEFDLNNLLNETLPVIEERKRKWKESGMDRVLDTFDLKTITDKVGNWLKKSEPQSSVSVNNSSLEDAQIMHFEDHKIQFNSDDSLQSADTAKYILSSRKRREASCTTMTIKRFRYVKGKQKELQKKYDVLSDFDMNNDLDKIFSKQIANYIPTAKQKMSRAMSEIVERPRFGSHRTPKRCNKISEESLNETFPKVTAKAKFEPFQRRKCRQKKRRSVTHRKRSVSSSSSSSTSSKFHIKPKFRRVSRKLKTNNKVNDIVDLTLLSAESDVSPRHVLSSITSKQQLNLPKSTELKSTQRSNLTCFSPESIVNSTSITNKKVEKPASTKNCHLSPIASKENSYALKLRPLVRLKKPLIESKNNDLKEGDRVTENQNAISITKTQNTDRKVLVYTPSNRSTSDNNFELTECHLSKSIGEKAAKRFIKFNAHKFPLKFDSSSTVYFKFPTESENSQRSGSSGTSEEEDVLCIFGKQGELVEYPLQKTE